ncbi:SET domain-containing protein 5 [Neopestalotiopsis sp. 37M]|nr:SET domain-containing protein 5 [Neopestalotiopsis sp. 37M]
MAHLSEEKREKFLAQAGELGGHRILDIMFTNSFQINLGGHDGQHFGNFPDVSRFNHDCRPNVAFYIDGNLTHHTHAIRDIEPGEELTISYLDSFRAREVRQQRAHASWGFACTCSQCSLSKDEADVSDARLYSIYEVENLLADLGNGKVTAEMIERLIDLYKQERLHFKIADAYTLAALNYNILGMAEMAQKYAQLSIDQGILEHGPEAPDIEAMRLLLANPQGHWTYNRGMR